MVCGSVVASSGFELCFFIFFKLKQTLSELTEEEHYKMLTKSWEGMKGRSQMIPSINGDIGGWQ